MNGRLQVLREKSAIQGNNVLFKIIQYKKKRKKKKNYMQNYVFPKRGITHPNLNQH